MTSDGVGRWTDKYQVQVRDQFGSWLAAFRPTTRSCAHATAVLVGGRVWNRYTRRPSLRGSDQ